MTLLLSCLKPKSNFPDSFLQNIIIVIIIIIIICFFAPIFCVFLCLYTAF